MVKSVTATELRDHQPSTVDPQRNLLDPYLRDPGSLFAMTMAMGMKDVVMTTQDHHSHPKTTIIMLAIRRAS